MSSGSKQSVTSATSSRATSSKVRRDLSRVLGESNSGVGGRNIIGKSSSSGGRRKPSSNNDAPRKRKLIMVFIVSFFVNELFQKRLAILFTELTKKCFIFLL